MPDVGRPTKYTVEMAEQAYKLCLLGFTNEELAEFFDVALDTIHAWRRTRPEFSYALREGRDIADAKVAKSLFKRACGYDAPDLHITTWGGDVIKTPIIKHYPPEPGAASHWLAVRRRNKGTTTWQKREETHHSGDATGGLAEQLARAIARRDGTSEE